MLVTHIQQFWSKGEEQENELAGKWKVRLAKSMPHAEWNKKVKQSGAMGEN